MPRLAIALPAALVLHILLFMTTLPDSRVVVPEIKGSGQVTVTIIPTRTRLPDVVDEPAAKPEPMDMPAEVVPPWELIAPEEPPVVETPPSRTETVEKPAAPVQQVPGRKQEEKLAAATLSPKPVRETASSQRAESLSPDGAAPSAAQQTLRSPEPLDEYNRPPVYPPLARKRGWQGTVLLEVDVLSNGMVQGVVVKESSSHDLLDKEALRAVRKWRFSPGSKNGQSRSMKVLVPVHFLLQDT